MIKNIVFGEKTLLILTIIFSVSAIYISYTTGIMTAYNDATAHLNTARRMIDSLTPGFVQIGSIWLPLLHLLELPFVVNDFLYFSGLAGAIVSGISFIVASVFLYKLVLLVTQKMSAAFLGALLFITNGNLLYMQTTAMFEPLLMSVVLAAVYYLAKWTKSRLINHLIVAAFFTCMATLTRYDGWAFFLAALFYVGIMTFFTMRKAREGPLIIFLFLASFGIVLWLAYNQLIFSDPLYFANSEYSAKSQQDVLATWGALPTKRNLELSAATYGITALVNLGVVSTILSIIGLAVYTFKNALSTDRWAPYLLLVPLGFNIVSLYLGQSVIWMPMIPPFFDTYFNARYGILMLPAAAFFVGFLASFRIFIPIVIAGIAAQFVLFFNPSLLPMFGREIGIITRQDTVSSINNQTLKTAEFLHTNYDEGLILLSAASIDSLIFHAQIPLKNYITEGSGDYWKKSLEDPRVHARWIVFFKDRTDRVGKKVGYWPKLKTYYDLKYEDQTFQVWKRNSTQ